MTFVRQGTRATDTCKKNCAHCFAYGRGSQNTTKRRRNVKISKTYFLSLFHLVFCSPLFLCLLTSEVSQVLVDVSVIRQSFPGADM